jgi:hypothetical protein
MKVGSGGEMLPGYVTLHCTFMRQLLGCILDRGMDIHQMSSMYCDSGKAGLWTRRDISGYYKKPEASAKLLPMRPVLIWRRITP